MKKIAAYLYILSATSLFGQISGTKAFPILELPIPARSNALGGATMAIWDNDVNLAHSNPALLNPGCARQLTFNYVNYISDLNYGNFAFASKLKKYGTFGVGLQFFSYGKFDGRDEYDIQTGTFKASDYCLNLSFAKTLNKDSSLSLGIALKTIYSHYDIYSSFGNVVDVGLTYHNKKNFTASLLAKNYGRQWKSYSPNSSKDPLPSDIQIGFSKKINKAPFRIIVLYDQLFKWDLTYTSALNQENSIDPFTNKPSVKTQSKTAAWFDNLGRHFTFGTEIIITKNFMLRVAYNYRKSTEMSLTDKKVANGLSLGFGFKVYKFHLNYGYSKFSLAGNSHTFGITTNLGYFGKK